MKETYIDFLSNPDYRLAALANALLWIMRVAVFPALVSLLLVRASIWVSNNYNVLARPSDRGSHSIPTPRLGGMGSAAAFYIGSLMLLLWEVKLPLEAWRLTVLIGGAWALIGGALDDFLELPPRWKLLLQLAAIGSVVAFGFAPTTFDVPFTTITLSPITGYIVALISTLFLMNIFNFMDGMDGQASVFGIVTGLGLALYMANHGIQYGFGITWGGMLPAAYAAMAAATLIGLLIHNYPGREQRTKTFMGDCGSQFYGYVFAVLALQAGEGAPEHRFPWIASFILFSPFMYDVAFTLVRRIRRGDNLTQAHRTHLYQRLMVAGWSHGKTLKLNLALYLCAVALAWLYAMSRNNGFVQIAILITTGFLLAGYTLFVMAVENNATLSKRKQGD